MGVVYEAYDRERDCLIALKMMRTADADHSARLKHEFRALADVAHDNIVGLYELDAAGDQLFFTMELVRGVSYLDYVWRAQRRRAGTANTAPLTQEQQVGLVRDRGIRPEVDLPRLRDTMRQLALGVAAMHGAGVLHRDLKPENVLVTAEGRVVIVDFGLAMELAPADWKPLDDRPLAGTTTYMSPEHAARLPVGPASDWYSVGVILYVALTGRPPFLGPSRQIAIDKQRFEPPPPRELIEDVPEDLDALVVDLLRREPDSRPTPREILRRLGAADPGEPQATMSFHDLPRLFGRDRELAELRAVRDRNEAALVRLRGRSGTGKSALADAFLDEVAADGALVLAGRCYERESLPYKAFDACIDRLVDALEQLDEAQLRAIMPANAPLIARLFPSFERLIPVARPRPRPLGGVPFEQRRRALDAVRELLANLARARRVVLFIDDLQWGDPDSGPLLDALLRGPDAPPIFTLLAYRDDGAADGPLIARAQAHPGAEIALGPLDEADATDLAADLLGRSGLPTDAASTIAAEAGGHPYFIQELIRFACAGVDSDRSDDGLSLDAVIARRVAQLPRGGRTLLEHTVVAGRPTPLSVVARAAGLDGAELSRVVNTLRAAQLVRTDGVRDRDRIEPYHDRIRETLLEMLSGDDARARHRALARALQQHQPPDPEALARHYLGAGEIERAVSYSLAAAEQAERSLAFDRAATLYEQALSLGDFTDDERRALSERLGDALANAGLGALSADAYLVAADGADQAKRLELQRRAAVQQLYTGHLDEGIALLSDVLSATGFRLARTPRRALFSLALIRARVRLRGTQFTRRDPSEIAPQTLERIDACMGAAKGLGMADFVRASEFQARGLLLSLGAGEPVRVAHALGLEIVVSACEGRKVERRMRKLLARLDRLCEETPDPMARSWRDGAQASIEFNLGRFEETVELVSRAIEQVSELPGASWEVASVDMFRLWSLYYLGRWRELSLRLQSSLTSAEQRGDLYTSANLRTGVFNTLHLARDQPALAETDLADAMAPWPRRDYHLQHYWELSARAQQALYCGRPDDAWHIIDDQWRALRRSLLMRIVVVRAEAIHLRARAALALAADRTGDERSSLLASARRAAARLDREKMPWTDGLAAAVRASAAAIEGDADAAGTLAAAADLLERAGMRAHAAAAALRGHAIAGTDDRDARAFLAEQGVVDINRIAKLLVP